MRPKRLTETDLERESRRPDAVLPRRYGSAIRNISLTALCPKAQKENRMKYRNASARLRRALPIAYATALAAVLTASLTPAHADGIEPPPVPSNIEVPAGNEVFLVGHAFGTQNYVCLPAGKSFQYTLFTPQATLFRDDDTQLTTHFFSPNPAEGSTVRATWQHSRDTSSVWAKVVPGDASSDPDFVERGAIAWLKLTVVGTEAGPGGGDSLTKTTFIQRLNTSGGLAPNDCRSKTDVGRQAFVPYAADYFFYRAVVE